jgi:hypothetical protein
MDLRHSGKQHKITGYEKIRSKISLVIEGDLDTEKEIMNCVSSLGSNARLCVNPTMFAAVFTCLRSCEWNADKINSEKVLEKYLFASGESKSARHDEGDFLFDISRYVNMILNIRERRFRF